MCTRYGRWALGADKALRVARPMEEKTGPGPTGRRPAEKRRSRLPESRARVPDAVGRRTAVFGPRPREIFDFPGRPRDKALITPAIFSSTARSARRNFYGTICHWDLGVGCWSLLLVPLRCSRTAVSSCSPVSNSPVVPFSSPSRVPQIRFPNPISDSEPKKWRSAMRTFKNK